MGPGLVGQPPQRAGFCVKAAAIGARSLNIGIMVPTKKTGQEPQFWLPIFLDPNVKNEG